MMRLGIDAWGLSGDLRNSGMGRYAATLLEAVPDLAPEIRAYAYGAPGESRPEWLHRDVIWRSLSSSAPRKLAALDSRLRELPRVVAADRLDVFHSPAVHVRPSLPPVPRLHCPVVATVHDVLPLTYYGRSLPVRLRAFYRWNLDRAASSSHVVTVSNFSKQEILRHTKLPAGNVTVIHNGVDFPPNLDPSALRRHGVKVPYLLYAGSYEPRKNLAGALESFRKVVEAGHPHQLVAVVERESGHAAAIHELLVRLELGGKVRLLHSLPQVDLRAVYSQAEIVLFPTLAEGFGLPPVQAAACGVPVIASDLLVLREIMGNAADFVDPHNPDSMAAATIELIKNQPRRREMAAAGIAKARLFRVDDCVRRHVEVYEKFAAASLTRAVAHA
jgi:glycosyltransferase involved in cell wall biosynthesis